jgi:tartrate dehydratase beta subunit/fumarate hydratase class I family protein
MQDSVPLFATERTSFADVGVETICEFDFKGMSVTVAVDSHGTSVHETGRRSGRRRSARFRWS